MFTRGSDSPIEQYLIPRRPLRIQSGFSDQLLPQFIGISENAPRAERASRTAEIHAEDFLRFIFDRKLDRTVMLIDKRVDEILYELFTSVGVLPDQMTLDMARTTVPFAFFEKDQTVGSAVADLMKSEMGSLYMDEFGQIIFINRLRDSGDPVATYNSSNIIDYSTSDETTIINSVNVKSEVRAVQPLQIVFNLSEAIRILPGETVTKFFQLDDPVTLVEPIIAFIANSELDGSGSDQYANVDIVTQTLFSTSLLLEIENTGAVPLYIISMTVEGTPAKVIRTVNVLEKDQTSIDEFEEQTYEVTSPYIQDEDTARSIALTIVRHFKDYGNTLELTVKSNPALQIGDLVDVDIDGIDDTFRVIKIVNVLGIGNFTQRLTVQKYEIPSYFILSSDSEARSLLDGEDLLAA
jgi:hypothetical protein